MISATKSSLLHSDDGMMVHTSQRELDSTKRSPPQHLWEWKNKSTILYMNSIYFGHFAWKIWSYKNRSPLSKFWQLDLNLNTTSFFYFFIFIFFLIYLIWFVDQRYIPAIYTNHMTTSFTILTVAQLGSRTLAEKQLINK